MTFPMRTCPGCGFTRQARRDGLCQSCGTKAGLAAAADRADRPELAPDWTGAECRNYGTDLWFPMPSPGRPASSADWATPRRICRDCPVLDQCGQWALTDPDPTAGEGMWGGMTPMERGQFRRLMRSRKEAA